MASITWSPYKSGLPEVTDADLNEVEAARGVKLPADYRETVKAHRGDIPTPGVANVGEAQIPVNALFFVKKDATENNSYNMWSYIEDLDGELGDIAARLVPFTSDSSHGIFVFDYRNGDTPSVSLVDMDLTEEEEGLITPVAGSFADFLNGLHD